MCWVEDDLELCGPLCVLVAPFHRRHVTPPARFGNNRRREVLAGGRPSCNDDLCDVQSIVSFEAAAGQSYLMRLGTFPGETGGTGAVSITCGLGVCPSAGACTAGHDTPGCDDETCCNAVCDLDAFCCDTEWDQVCANAAAADPKCSCP